MILDHIANLPSYLNYHPRLHRVLEFLEVMPWCTMEPGKYPIDGSALYAIIEPSQGRGQAGAILETHKRYLDLQMCQKGEDLIGWRPLNSCHLIQTPYDESRDISFFNDKPDLWLPVHQQQFALFTPADAHAPLSCEGLITKLIFKIAIH